MYNLENIKPWQNTGNTFQIFYIFYSQDYTSTDGAPLPRCNQEEFYTYGDVKGGGYSSARNRCPASQVINPDNVFRILENRELIQESQYQQAVQIKPQHVSLTLRISKSVALKLSAYYHGHWYNIVWLPSNNNKCFQL